LIGCELLEGSAIWGEDLISLFGALGRVLRLHTADYRAVGGHTGGQ
jgi:hypothetical protein